MIGKKLTYNLTYEEDTIDGGIYTNMWCLNQQIEFLKSAYGDEIEFCIEDLVTDELHSYKDPNCAMTHTPFIFTYGTLMKGEKFNNTLGESEYIMDAIVPGVLYVGPGYPYMVKSDGESRVSGEVYRLSDSKVLERIDFAERGGGCVRTILRIEITKEQIRRYNLSGLIYTKYTDSGYVFILPCWAWVFTSAPLKYDDTPCEVIPSGSWNEYSVREEEK